MSKKKEVELDPDAEKWVAEEDARFEAEVMAANQSALDEDEARARAEEDEDRDREEAEREGHPDEG